jgi:PhzF family phenazine biosynthesis protein
MDPAVTAAGGDLLRLAAFTDDPAGGNPAGVWIGRALPPPDEMLRIAAAVGYSETAFLAPADGPGAYRVRYFSPLAEVPFCGHATIASGVALAGRGAPDALVLTTNGGDVPVQLGRDATGRIIATLTSVATHSRDAPASLVAATLACLGWAAADLDADHRPALAFAGATHLVLVARELGRLRELEYPFETLQRLMLDADLTTIALMARTGPDHWRARDPFPVGGVVEDPATGAAAAAFGGYLRGRGMLQPPATIEIEQGVEMGRPSRLTVTVEPGEAGVRVSGTATPISPEAGSAGQP